MRNAGFHRAHAAALRIERTGFARIHVRSVKCDHGFRPGQKNALIFARFPHVAQGTQLEVELDPAGHGEFQLFQFLRLIAGRVDADGICSGREQRQVIVTVGAALCSSGRGARVFDGRSPNGFAGDRIEQPSGNDALRCLTRERGGPSDEEHRDGCPLKKGTDRSVHVEGSFWSQMFAIGDRVVCPLFQQAPSQSSTMQD